MIGKKNLTHRAARATALLLALSGMCAWLGDGSDALISAGVMDADDEGTGYSYLRRKLAAALGRTSQNPAFVANRARLMAAPGCRGVLLTSQGGVGSSAFITAIERVQIRGGASFYTNDDQDLDGFKHLPASRWTDHDPNGLRGANRDGEAHCFARALVVVGDPVHTVESTHRRFRFSHINKLKTGSGLGYYPNSMPLANLYDDMVAEGFDTTGITQYVRGWYEASRDRDRWPDVRIVTARTLFDHAEDHARWIGVEEEDLSTFRRMSFDASRRHRTAPSVSSAETAERVMEVFAEAIDLVDAIDEIPYDQGARPDEEPDEELPATIKRNRRRRAQRRQSARRAGGERNASS